MYLYYYGNVLMINNVQLLISNFVSKLFSILVYSNNHFYTIEEHL